MKRIAAILILAAFHGADAAEWTRVGGNNNVACYADPASISRKGNLATMTNLLNFTTAQTELSVGHKPYRSQKETREFDCINERYRRTRFSLRADFMFGGALVNSIAADGAWNPVVPGSLGDALWKFACGKK